jgi:hypothetical protein
VQYNDGSGYRLPAELLPNLLTNTWYVLRIVVDDVRGFTIEACQEGTSICGSYNQWMPTGLTWRFQHWIYRGTAYVDDYREFDANSLSWTSDERMNFTYDALDRLQGVSPDGSTSAYTGNYQYTTTGNIFRKGNGSTDNGYDYAATASNCASGTPSLKPHAVSRTWDWNWYATTTGSFSYDCNSNMTSRTEGSTTYAQTWTVENRVNTIAGNGQNVQYFYDGDGNRVMQVQISGTQVITTAYAGAIEVQITATQRITKAYSFAGSQLIAVRNVHLTDAERATRSVPARRSSREHYLNNR